MSADLNSFSIFYYNFEVTELNQFLNFNEGGPELSAVIPIGSYSMQQLALAVRQAMEDAGAQLYTVTTNRQQRSFTIAATSNFDLLVSSGSQSASSIFGLLGLTGADRTGSNSYTGNVGAGDIFEPQFKMQSYISKDNWQQSVDGVVRKSASAKVEVVRFGVEKFIQANITYQTNIAQDAKIIKNDSQGVENLQAFMQFITQKKPFEFMPDIENRNIFDTVILESSPESKDGIAYKLKELYTRGLPGYYETGILTFRVID